MSDEQTQAENQHKCPRCGTPFTCGLQAEHASCWCFAFPHIITAENTTRQGCLCPKCLGELIEKIKLEEKNEASSPE